MLTDGGSQPLLDLCRANVERNRPLLDECKVSVERLSWGADAPPSGPFDVLLASDVLYDDDSHPALCATLRAALSDAAAGRGARCVIAQEHGMPLESSSGSGEFEDASLQSFVRAAAGAGLRVSVLRGEQYAPAPAEGATWEWDEFTEPVGVYLLDVSML